MTENALIFDCDGVLADTEKDGHRVAFNEAFAAFGIPLNWGVSDYGPLLEVGGGKERIRAAMTSEVLREAGRSQEPADLDELILLLHQYKTQRYRQIVEAGGLPARPGVARLAAEALANDWRVAIASTSAPESVRAVADHVLPPHVAREVRVFAGDLVPHKKPAPDIYLAAARELDVSVERCVAIEDSPIGCASAVSAGMRCVVTESEYTTGDVFEGAALVLSDLGEPGGAPVAVRSNPGRLLLKGELRVEHLKHLLTPSHGTAPGGEAR
ncbi:HAD-IA family hydrolase [Nocardioides sp. CER19]|uniref:HAD-IA family hydrolase n=1 Tax=Nocardioides sp. CER19 TaxID=3038538 RepID=UPI00244B04A6|nr:HAD-IA family hydrolase [Nocardioides sp. CER19]MDH2416169.1 HAD-IA family hydrolase [Nocardioides sp. CER19]